MRQELSKVPSGVLGKLPRRENLTKSIRHVRRKELPTNPKSLADLDEIPERYRNTALGETFLIFDSNDNGDDLNGGRIIVFANKKKTKKYSLKVRSGILTENLRCVLMNEN